ncbi:glycoside hydrolase family 3 C-terminal domain-containing protein [Schleiferilactobacillus perolens]|jgi:beta-glucosidase|uniref:glycoside hydrolase family 3 C-terminal domain-containing protein n=1 Tax=Schleiferilactobacillus perolens TaxID=100468 RepID=UPI00235719E0|nr:glycoside hydrolase family 3 C-terminal domain-containing protein [Schleiferilactobacillus perolens]MCI2172146.1 glycoside hydrolase family 3 C-terminal domain-containing protein [Schleiferilactobacillus perolens]
MLKKQKQYNVPNAYGLTPEEQVKLTSGADFWGTEAFPAANIPRFRMSDGPHGLRYQAGAGDALGINHSEPSTAFPTGSALACTWDPALVAAMGAAIGQEARSLDVDMVLGPGLNIKRNPLCGRNFEYFSEDPVLTGHLAAGWVKGIQSTGVGACVKHFAANNQENDRLRSNSIVDPIALHELYLTAFRIAVKAAQPEGVMCSYNRINGTYASDNRYLLSDVLRKTWGFNGAVITDWGALNDKVASLNAGTDLEMPGDGHMFDQQALQGLADGRLAPTALTRAVAKIAQLAQKKRPAFQGDRQKLLTDNAQLAQKIEENAAVLLKNDDHILPLKETDNIVVVGEMAEQTRFQGAGSSHINPPTQVSILEGLDNAHVAYHYEPGYRLTDDTGVDAAAAVAAARDADKVIFVAGLPEIDESEGFDRTTMALPAVQNKLIEAIAAVNPHIVVLLIAGAPVELPWTDHVQGLLNLYLGGESVGNAASRLLYGIVNPSGKLAETYPMQYQDVPSSQLYGKNNGSVGYAESVYVGYRYYDKAAVPVRFPFGFGLSYTDFTLQNAVLSAAQITPDGQVQVNVTVTNTGTTDGAEVVQVYVGDAAADTKALTPKQTLQGFAKVFLAAGTSQIVTITLPAQAFKEWDDHDQRWLLPTGQRQIRVATSSDAAGLVLPITLAGENTSVRPVKVPDWYIRPQGHPSMAAFEEMSGLHVPVDRAPVPGMYTPLSTPRELSEYSWTNRHIMDLAREKMIGTKNPTTPADRFMEKIIMDTPIIRLAQQSSGMLPLAVVNRLVGIANRRYWRAIRNRY